MAERTGFSLGKLSLIEHGKLEITIHTIATLAEAIGYQRYSSRVIPSLTLKLRRLEK